MFVSLTFLVGQSPGRGPAQLRGNLQPQLQVQLPSTLCNISVKYCRIIYLLVSTSLLCRRDLWILCTFPKLYRTIIAIVPKTLLFWWPKQKRGFSILFDVCSATFWDALTSDLAWTTFGLCSRLCGVPPLTSVTIIPTYIITGSQ